MMNILMSYITSNASETSKSPSKHNKLQESSFKPTISKSSRMTSRNVDSSYSDGSTSTCSDGSCSNIATVASAAHLTLQMENNCHPLNFNNNLTINSAVFLNHPSFNSCTTNASSTTQIEVVINQIDPIERKYVLYQVEVTMNDSHWFINKRFSEFHQLLDALKKKYPRVALKLPAKKIFVNNFSNELIKSRITGLNDFIRQVTNDQRLVSSPEVRSFFNFTRKFDREQSLDDNGMDQGSGSDQEQPMDIDESRLSINVVLGPSEVQHIKASDFEFLKLIGKGSFGKVLLARHVKESCMYAVKVLSKKMILKRNEKTHIMCERSVLLKNLKHPFLVGLRFSFQSRDKLYFVMDYVNGGELFFHLQKEKCFTESRAKFYAAEITSALGYLHSEGIVYRDLKPENILLDADGHVVLTDFGLCKGGLVSDRDTTNTFCGTPEYLAPEVLKKEAYDRCVDWWCLGAVLYEMIYGLPPFYSRDQAEMYDQILHAPLRTKGNISLAARDLLSKLLEKDKSRRLGHNRDVEDIKQHDFFSSINWDDLDEKKITPPFNPQVRGALDLKNIDTEFTREPIPASVAQSNLSADSSVPANAFEGFSYVDSLSHYAS